ncbi:unnamed protein product [Polarella glacialis]|uniref:Uncharacterized protein n=2 Tax=Polarella glacialis TaxID=89957 RepID=A0A813DQ02_POLGL|nr:unnamed protein product [Polarella glacialis]
MAFHLTPRDARRIVVAPGVSLQSPRMSLLPTPTSAVAAAASAGRAVACGLRRLPASGLLTVHHSKSAPDLSAAAATRAGKPPASVVVVAPGAGMGANSQAYKELGQGSRFTVRVLGTKGAPYDRYPACWGGRSNGAPPPNLESFASEVLRAGVSGLGDVLVVGSRGGQVVLPCIWRALGDAVPPAVVINGGCAMSLPGPPTVWPENAVTFLLIGGQDYFGQGAGPEEYMEKTRSLAPARSCSTAILFVSEMRHVPGAALLGPLLGLLVQAVLAWKAAPKRSAPVAQLQEMVALLSSRSFSGRLLFTASAGCWQELPFGPNLKLSAQPAGPNPKLSAQPARSICHSKSEGSLLRAPEKESGVGRRLLQPPGPQSSVATVAAQGPTKGGFVPSPTNTPRKVWFHPEASCSDERSEAATAAFRPTRRLAKMGTAHDLVWNNDVSSDSSDSCNSSDADDED